MEFFTIDYFYEVLSDKCFLKYTKQKKRFYHGIRNTLNNLCTHIFCGVIIRR